MDSGSRSGSGSVSGRGTGVGDFCFAGGLDGPARELEFLEEEARVLDKAASVAEISTISESSSDTTTRFLPLRAGCFLGFSDSIAALDGSGFGGTDVLADLRVGAVTSSTPSSSSCLTTTEVLALLVLVETLELAVGRPFRGGGMVSSFTAAGSSLATPRLRLTGGGESSTGCPSSSASGTSLSTVFDRVEVRIREVADGCFFAREGGFSTVPSVASTSTSDRPRFLRDVEAFSSGGTEADVDLVARRGGIGG